MAQNKAALPRDANGRTVEIPFFPVQAMAGVPFSQTSVMTSAIPTPFSNCYARIVATQPCFYKPVSSSGAATTADHYLPANVPYDIELRQKNKIAVIGASSTPVGSFYVSIRGS